MPNIGERIYRLRSGNNMSQGELAEKLDVSRQAVSKWENNISIPELDKIAAISELFGVTTDEIIKGEAPKEEKKIHTSPIMIEHTQTENEFSKRKTLQILGIIFLVLGILLATLMALMAKDWIFIALFILLAVNGVVLLVSKKRLWIALLIVNTALILMLYFVFGTNMFAPKQSATEEITESISMEPEGLMLIQ